MDFELRKLYLIMTRATQGIIIITNLEVLLLRQEWATFISWAESKEIVVESMKKILKSK